MRLSANSRCRLRLRGTPVCRRCACAGRFCSLGALFEHEALQRVPTLPLTLRTLTRRISQVFKVSLSFWLVSNGADQG